MSLIRALRFIVDFTVFAYRSAAPVFRLSANRNERISVLHYTIRLFLRRTVLVLTRALTAQVLSNDAVVRIKGTTYHVGIDEAEIASFKEIYEDHDYDALSSFVSQPGWTVFDVGANIGVFAVLQARRGAQVYAFEPNPSSFRRLSQTISSNGLSASLVAYNVGVGAGKAIATLTVPRGWTTNGQLSITDVQEASSESSSHLVVAIVSLDDFVDAQTAASIDLLKIDTEGFEIEVLNGARRTLSNVRRIVLEYHSIEKRDLARAIVERHGFVEQEHLLRDADAGVGILYFTKLEIGGESAS